MPGDPHPQRTTAIGVWENEGDAPRQDPVHEQYGRRIETDRSWTVYHVFTGVAARADGQTMTGLSRSDATKAMLALNRRNDGLRKDWGNLATRKRLASSAMED